MVGDEERDGGAARGAAGEVVDGVEDIRAGEGGVQEDDVRSVAVGEPEEGVAVGRLAEDAERGVPVEDRADAAADQGMFVAEQERAGAGRGGPLPGRPRAPAPVRVPHATSAVRHGAPARRGRGRTGRWVGCPADGKAFPGPA
ncbi:hypothetical protein GCM10020229_76560 [Kitasatospora albolonga]